MRTSAFFIFIVTLVFLFSAKTFAVDPDSLIEVTPGNNPNCVEYYNYNDTLYCSTTAQDTKPLDPELAQAEKLHIVFDDRPWKIGWGKQDDMGTMLEYVPNGEDINNWHELVTSQFYPGLQEKITLKDYAQGFINDLKKDGFKPITTFHEETPDRVIFEFRLEEPANQIQDELQMVTKDDKGIYILHYVIKEKDMGEENRKLWLDNLKNSTIKENNSENNSDNNSD